MKEFKDVTRISCDKNANIGVNFKCNVESDAGRIYLDAYTINFKSVAMDGQIAAHLEGSLVNFESRAKIDCSFDEARSLMECKGR